MNDFKHFHPAWHHTLNVIVVSLAFITVGVLWILRNLGVVDPTLFSIIVSWQMLLILWGVVQFIKQHYIGGVILIVTGGYFLLPLLTDIDQEWIHTFWPGIFILVGFLILFKKRKYRHHWGDRYKGKERLEQCVTVDGFVQSEVSFGGVHQIVLDPVFKGAKIDNSFGSTVLDLRKTTLAAPETYIDIECSFGSVELLIPPHWNVIVETDTTFSGSSDKRRSPVDNQIDFDHKLIIRGDISFSGLEIKS